MSQPLKTPHHIIALKSNYGSALATNSDDELVALLQHQNTWWARQARRLLTERAATSEKARKSLAASLHKQFEAANSLTGRLRILETLVTAGGASSDWLIERLSSTDEYERKAALRFLVDSEAGSGRPLPDNVIAALKRLAKADASGLVQLHLASALQRLPLEERWEIAGALASRSEFAGDRMLPLMIWYGIEPAVPANPARAVDLLKSSRMPIVTECIARRLAADAEKSPAGCEALVDLLLAGKCGAPQCVLHGMSLAFKGQKNASSPAGWQRVSATYGASPEATIRDDVQSLNVVFGDRRTLEELRSLVTNTALPANERNQALRSLLLSPPADYADMLVRLLSDHVVAFEAIRGLAHFNAAEIPERLLTASKAFSPPERAEMIQTLSSRPAFARELLKAIRDKRVSSSELTAIHARQIASFEDEALNRELVELWGDIRITSAEKKSRGDAYKAQISAAALEKADRPHGRALFQKTCANCHILFGAGRRVGPDITGSNRKNLDYLIDNIVDPSATVGADFRTVVVVLDSGRVLNGVVSEQNEQTLTLLSAQELITIDRSEIEAMKTSNVSLMPDGLLQNLTNNEVRDLVAYLMSSEQIPLPE